MKVLDKLADEGTTMVIVTHEPALAREIADRVVLLRGGRIARDGAPREVLDTTDPGGRDPR
jgi:ABC-type histidine transport system ATPase subunit